MPANSMNRLNFPSIRTELLRAVWVSIEDIKSRKIDLKDYTQFVV